jgi:hypothetical protein
MDARIANDPPTSGADQMGALDHLAFCLNQKLTVIPADPGRDPGESRDPPGSCLSKRNLH